MPSESRYSSSRFLATRVLFAAASSFGDKRQRRAGGKTWDAATAFRLADNGIMATRRSESAAMKFFAPIRHRFYLYEWTYTVRYSDFHRAVLIQRLDKVKFKRRTDGMNCPTSVIRWIRTRRVGYISYLIRCLVHPPTVECRVS